MTPEITAYWQAFLASPAGAAFAGRVPYDTLAIGDSRGSRKTGAALILAGRKTATSARPRDFTAAIGPPYPGALSIVIDGEGRPVGIVETVELRSRRLDQLDAAFARDYGEWDGTLPTLRRELAAYYGLAPDEMLLCERFRLVWPAPGAPA